MKALNWKKMLILWFWYRKLFLCYSFCVKKCFEVNFKKCFSFSNWYGYVENLKIILCYLRKTKMKYEDHLYWRRRPSGSYRQQQFLHYKYSYCQNCRYYLCSFSHCSLTGKSPKVLSKQLFQLTRLSVLPSLFRPCVQKLSPIPALVSQNFNHESCLISI